jgi:hypothetical protein
MALNNLKMTQNGPKRLEMVWKGPKAASKGPPNKQNGPKQPRKDSKRPETAQKGPEKTP